MRYAKSLTPSPAAARMVLVGGGWRVREGGKVDVGVEESAGEGDEGVGSGAHLDVLFFGAGGWRGADQWLVCLLACLLASLHSSIPPSFPLFLTLVER